MKKKLTLTEEKERMIKLMGFDYKDNSHDVLSEQNNKSAKAAYDQYMVDTERESTIEYPGILRGRSKKSGDINMRGTDIRFGTMKPVYAYLKSKGLNISGINTKWLFLEMASAASLEGMWKLTPPDKPKIEREDIPLSIEVNFELTDPFNFDSTVLTKSGRDSFDRFIENYKIVKEDNMPVWDEYLKYLKSKSPIKLYGYASQDGDPTKKIADSNNKKTKTLEACRKSGGRSRESYDLCLSQKRAEKMVELIESELPELNGILSAEGKGYSCRSGKCWKPTSTNHSSKNTAKDRYFFVEWPTFTKKDKPTKTTKVIQPEPKDDPSIEDVKSFDGYWNIGEVFNLGDRDKKIEFKFAENRKNILVNAKQLKKLLGDEPYVKYMPDFYATEINGDTTPKVTLKDSGVVLEAGGFEYNLKGWTNATNVDIMADQNLVARTQFIPFVLKQKGDDFEIGGKAFGLSMTP